MFRCSFGIPFLTTCYSHLTCKIKILMSVTEKKMLLCRSIKRSDGAGDTENMQISSSVKNQV